MVSKFLSISKFSNEMIQVKGVELIWGWFCEFEFIHFHRPAYVLLSKEEIVERKCRE